MSAQRKIIDAKPSINPARKATVVKIIRGTTKPAPSSESKPASSSKSEPASKKPPIATPKSTHAVTEKPRVKLEPRELPGNSDFNIDEDRDIVLKAVQQPKRTRYRDLTEMPSKSETRDPGSIRLARGPHFPMATSLRFAALFYLIGRICMIASIGSLVWFAVSDGNDYLYMAPILASAIIFTAIAWVVSTSLRCRVCTMPFLSKKKCKMSKKAPKLPLVSHQFTAALHILTHNYPRCPYCGTTNRLKK